MNKVIILILSVFLISSCSDKFEPVGKWDDIIKLSTKSVEFDANKNSITVKTEGDWWWISSVSVNGESFLLPQDVNIESNSYIFKQDCFIVEKKDKNTLYIEIEKNQSNAEKKITVVLEAGDYFDRVSVTQSAE